MSDEVDYLLSILGKERYAAMDHWMPTDSAHRNDAGRFLNYLESVLDDEISPCVRVYDLANVKRRTDETINALVDHICQLACCALIGDGSDAAVKFEVQHRLIHAIPDSDIELRRSFSRSVETRVPHTYWRSAVHTMPLSPELLQCVLAKLSTQYRSPIDLKSNHRSIPCSARIAHTSTHLA